MDRVLEEGHIPRRPHRRCRLRTTPRSRSGPCTTEPREGRGASGFSAPAPPGEAPPEAPTPPRRCLGSRLQCSASPTRSGAEPSPRRPRPAGARARRAPGRRPPESAVRPLAECAPGATSPSRRRPPCASGRATRVSASWGPVIAQDRSSPPTSTTINTTPALVTMPPGRAPSGGETPLLPAAHLSPSRGVNRQLARLSPIWSHPSPRT